MRPGDYRSMLVVLIIAASAMPRSWDVVDYDYQSRIHSKPVVLARYASFLVLAAVRVLMVPGKAACEAPPGDDRVGVYGRGGSPTRARLRRRR